MILLQNAIHTCFFNFVKRPRRTVSIILEREQDQFVGWRALYQNSCLSDIYFCLCCVVGLLPSCSSSGWSPREPSWPLPLIGSIRFIHSTIRVDSTEREYFPSWTSSVVMNHPNRIGLMRLHHPHHCRLLPPSSPCRRPNSPNPPRSRGRCDSPHYCRSRQRPITRRPMKRRSRERGRSMRKRRRKRRNVRSVKRVRRLRRLQCRFQLQR